jgi:hypothetical protein
MQGELRVQACWGRALMDLGGLVLIIEDLRDFSGLRMGERRKQCEPRWLIGLVVGKVCFEINRCLFLRQK